MPGADSSLTTSDLDELRTSWPALEKGERVAVFHELPRDVADDFFLSLDSRDQCEVLLTVPEGSVGYGCVFLLRMMQLI